MKKLYVLMVVMVCCLLVSGIAFAQQDDIKKHPSCKYCGMDREKVSHSRMYLEYDNGSTEGVASLHCAALDLATNTDTTPKAIMVGDYNTKNLIDAEKAFWVVGGTKTGVMTARAKWAFDKKENAEKFISENGGKLSTFDEAMNAAYEDMYKDTKMLRDKKKMMKK